MRIFSYVLKNKVQEIHDFEQKQILPLCFGDLKSNSERNTCYIKTDRTTEIIKS